jgi:hypothetical protein
MLILPCDGFVHYETIGTHETSNCDAFLMQFTANY